MHKWWIRWWWPRWAGAASWAKSAWIFIAVLQIRHRRILWISCFFADRCIIFFLIQIISQFFDKCPFFLPIKRQHVPTCPDILLRSWFHSISLLDQQIRRIDVRSQLFPFSSITDNSEHNDPSIYYRIFRFFFPPEKLERSTQPFILTSLFILSWFIW